MATEKWVNLGTRNCDVAGKEVELMEKRIYPAGLQSGTGDDYRVVLRKCSAGYQCGAMEDPCVWAETGHDGRLYRE